MSSKTLVIIRHAHRDTEVHSRDNGLSEKGREQVKRLVKFAENRFNSKPFNGVTPFFFSSPKKRCIETISPIAEAFEKKVEVDLRLSEHGPAENEGAYLARIDEFLNFWKSECPELTVICSHGDWIPIAVQKLTGSEIGLRKAGWCEVEYAQGESFLSWIVQKHF